MATPILSTNFYKTRFTTGLIAAGTAAGGRAAVSATAAVRVANFAVFRSCTTDAIPRKIAARPGFYRRQHLGALLTRLY